MKLRVCHLTSVHKALDTRIFYKECRSLAERYEVYLIAPYSVEGPRDNVYIIPVRPNASRFRRFFITDSELLIKALRVKAAIYHLHDPELLPVGLALRLTGAKVIYDVHEDVSADLRIKAWLPIKSIFLRLYKLAEIVACRKMHLILTEDSYISKFAGRARHFTVVRNFPDLELLRPLRIETPLPSNSILLVGNLGGKRGLETILEALYLLQKKDINIQLVAVGEKDAQVEKVIKASEAYLYVMGQVQFIGYKPLTEAYAFAGQCFAGLALPEDTPNHYNSYPTKLFEYMAVGLPVICSDFPINKDVVEGNSCGICVDPSNAAELAGAIAYLYSSQIVSWDMAKNGIQAVEEKYNWQKEKDNLFRFYREVQLCTF